MNKPDIWLTIDPGVSGTGIVMWEVKPKSFRVGSFMILYGLGKHDWAQRVLDIRDSILSLCLQSEVVRIYCELPAFWERAGPRMWAKQGSLVKQSILVGSILGLSYMGGAKPTVTLVPVNDWKGNLSKAIVIERVRRCLGTQSEAFTEHVWDAAGIGLWAFAKNGYGIDW